MKQKQLVKKQGCMSKQKKTWVFGLMAVVAFVAGLGLLITGFASTVGNIKKEAVSRAPEAILMNAGVSEDREILMPVSYYDQRSDDCVNIYDTSQSAILYRRQFGWSNCEYHYKEIEKGLVEYELDENHLPVLVSGELTPNRGLDDAERWFESVDGKSENYIGAIKMEYSAAGAVFSFIRDEFYPLDEAKFSDGDVVNKDGHNHLFTMGLAVPFTALISGEEAFEIEADDDTFVFVGDRLVIDMGGIHERAIGRFVIHEDGEVYAASGDEELAFTGVTLARDDNSAVRIFHADRDADDSVFNVVFSGMNVTIVDTKMAQRGDGDSLQIAYDPTDLTYEAPLGQSVVMKPDNTRGYVVMLTIEGIMIVVFAVLIVMAIRVTMEKRS